MNFASYLFYLFFLDACLPSISHTPSSIDDKFKKYWYAGEAELTSYRLEQARYGEMREGHAVLIFVTEDFSPTQMVKADNPGRNDVSVLKLNFTKKFNTGIYPYSMMSSSFTPVNDPGNCLKISASSQEWCGHSYTEAVFLKTWEVDLRSYFQGESGHFSLGDAMLEDEIWSIIRIDPKSIPTGKLNLVPGFFYLRLGHARTASYEAEIKRSSEGDNTTLTIMYPGLERTLKIVHEKSFPYSIISWEDTYPDGFGSNRKQMTTRGTRIKSIKSDYWRRHGNDDGYLRKELGIE